MSKKVENGHVGASVVPQGTCSLIYSVVKSMSPDMLLLKLKSKEDHHHFLKQVGKMAIGNDVLNVFDKL